MTLTSLSYRSWQTIVRLPALVLMAYFTDQRIDLHQRQIGAWMDTLFSFGISAQSQLLQQLAEDAIEEGPLYVAQHALNVVPQLPLAFRYSLNIARAELTPDEFLAWANVSAHMIDVVSAASPTLYRHYRRMLWLLRLQQPTSFVPALQLVLARAM